MRTRAIVLLTVSALLVLATREAAASAKDNAVRKLRELQPKLQQLKSKGLAGETDTGTVAAVKNRPLGKAAGRIVADVNANRIVLYRSIAREQNVPVEHVARLSGERHWRNARPGEWFRRKGKWIQKK